MTDLMNVLAPPKKPQVAVDPHQDAETTGSLAMSGPDHRGPVPSFQSVAETTFLALCLVPTGIVSPTTTEKES